jgi:hypothetical protein
MAELDGEEEAAGRGDLEPEREAHRGREQQESRARQAREPPATVQGGRGGVGQHEQRAGREDHDQVAGGARLRVEEDRDGDQQVRWPVRRQRADGAGQPFPRARRRHRLQHDVGRGLAGPLGRCFDAAHRTLGCVVSRAKHRPSCLTPG